MTSLELTRSLLGVGVVGGVVAIIVWTSRERQKPASPITSALPSASPAFSLQENEREQKPFFDRQSAQSVAASETLPEASSSLTAGPQPGTTPLEGDLTTELEEVQRALRDFNGALGENPVGTNAEITRALLGDNLKQVKLPIPVGSKVNAAGELCDRWGTPYFFHQVSGRQMEVHSAGPDGVMWTADDRQM